MGPTEELSITVWTTGCSFGPTLDRRSSFAHVSAWGKCHEDLWVHVLHGPLGRCSPKGLHYLPARLNEAPHTWWMEGPSTNLSVNLQGTQYGYMAVKYQWISNFLIFRLIFRQKSTGFRMFDSLDSLPKQPKKVAKPPHIWAKLGQMRNSGKKKQNLSIKSQKKNSTSQPYLGRIWGVSVGPLQSHFMDSQRLIPGADVHTFLACAKEMALMVHLMKNPVTPKTTTWTIQCTLWRMLGFCESHKFWLFDGKLMSNMSNGTHVEFVV